MVELFDYEGREWFNVGTGCLLLAIIYLTQLFWCVAGNQAGLWFYPAINFAGFTLLGLAIIAKRPSSAISAVIAMFFMAFSNMEGQFGLVIPQYDTLMTGLATVSIMLLGLSIADIIFEFTDIDVKQNYLIVASFAFMLLWSILRFTPVIQGVAWANKAIPMMWETALVASLLSIPFSIVSILAMLKEILPRFIDIEEETLNNIAFILCVLLFIVALVRWNAGGLFQLFG